MDKPWVKRPVNPPANRKLRIYAVDPLVTDYDKQIVTVEVPWEKLELGPIGNRVEVIDYDPAANTYYNPVDLDDPNVLAQDGLAPSESDPGFHQQMVYAVVMATHTRFERALGRYVPLKGDFGKLRIFPHGTREPNAFFSPSKGGLVFGYFRASRTDFGRNLPGGTVFSCLSHDVIAHETTHCILHGLRRKYLEPTGPDVFAFHEAFADIVAIFQRFTLPGFLEDALQRTHAKLDSPDPLFDLGRQFGEAIGQRKALRNALNKKPNPKALSKVFEPHRRGAILLAAVFDAFVTVYQRRTRDLLRLASGGSAILPAGDLAPDLVGRLAKEARKTSKHFLNICIRAIDYCPPVDIEFGDFLRAIITADREIVPDDPWGYRMAFIDSFRKHGIYPQDVFSLAEDSLVWQPPSKTLNMDGFNFKNVRFDHSYIAAQKQYRNLHRALFSKSSNLTALGFKRNLPVQISSIRPLQRISPNGRIANELVIMTLQRGEAMLDKIKAPKFMGGCTLIINQEGRVRFSILKSIESRERKERQRMYLHDLESARPFEGDDNRFIQPSFRMIHRGW